MTPAFVQAITASESTGTGSYTSSAFASPTTTGNLIVVVAGDDSGVNTGGVTSVTDSKGNAYIKVTENGASGTTLSIWYAKNITGGSSHTITVHYSTANATCSTFSAQEFSGCDQNTPLDVSKMTGGGPSTAASSGASSATTYANELVIAAVTHNNGSVLTITPGTGYTNQSTPAYASFAASSMASKVVSATGAQTAAFTLSGSAPWNCAVATFIGAGQISTANPGQFFPFF